MAKKKKSRSKSSHHHDDDDRPSDSANGARLPAPVPATEADTQHASPSTSPTVSAPSTQAAAAPALSAPRVPAWADRGWILAQLSTAVTDAPAAAVKAVTAKSSPSRPVVATTATTVRPAKARASATSVNPAVHVDPFPALGKSPPVAASLPVKPVWPARAGAASAGVEQATAVLSPLPSATLAVLRANSGGSESVRSTSPTQSHAGDEIVGVRSPIVSNKQRKRLHRAVAYAALAQLEESQRLEVEALQSMYLTDLQLIGSTPSLTVKLTSIPSHLRVTVLPEPLLDREKDNHVVTLLDIQYQPIPDDGALPRPPIIAAYSVKGLSTSQLASLSSYIQSERNVLFASDVHHDGILLSLLSSVQEWLRQHNTESASFYDQMKQRERALLESKAQESKAREAARRQEEEHRRKKLAREIAEANKRKELAWKEEKSKFNQLQHAVTSARLPSFTAMPGRANAAADSSSFSSLTSMPASMSVSAAKPNHTESIILSSPGSSPSLPTSRGDRASRSQTRKHESKLASKHRNHARRAKEQRNEDHHVHKVDSDDESKKQSSDSDGDSDLLVAPEEDVEELFPSPLIAGAGLSFFDQKRKNELALLAQLDQRGSTGSRRTSNNYRHSDKNNESENDGDSASDSEDDSESEDSEDAVVDRRRPLPTAKQSPPLPVTATFSRYRADFEVLQLLGRGGFGAVYKVRNLVDKLLYAIKVIRLRSGNSAMNQKLIREVSTIAMLHHSYICRYYSSWLESCDNNASGNDDGLMGESIDEDEEQDWLSSSYASHSQFKHSAAMVDNDHDSGSAIHRPSLPSHYLYIQMEYCPNKTLKDFITDGSSLRHPDLCWRLLRQMFEAVSYIHTKGIMHRDLKPANVFIDQNQNVKIGDFGLAVLTKVNPMKTGGALSQSSQPLVSRQSSHSHGNSDELSLMSRESDVREVVGTVFYRSPEQEAEGQLYDEKADIWALGVIAFELFHTFDSQSERAHVLMALRQTHRVPKDFMAKSANVVQAEKDKIASLIHWLINDRPALRPSASEVLKSGLIPLKLEDEYLAVSLQLLTNQSSPHYSRLLELLFSHTNDPLIDYTYDYLSQTQSLRFHSEKSLVPLPLPLMSLIHFQHKCFDSLIQSFLLHGACYYATPLIAPRTGHSEIENKSNQVLLMDSTGVLVKLPYTLTLPFARFVAQNAASSVLDHSNQRDPRSQSSMIGSSSWSRNSLLLGGDLIPLDFRRYDIAKVYRRNPAGGRPREVYEADFDYVWASAISSDHRLSISEDSNNSPLTEARREAEQYEREKRLASLAECISVALDCLSPFNYAIGPVLVRVNHLALLELVIAKMIATITDNDKKSATRLTLYRLASHFAVSAVPWLRSTLRKQLIGEGQFTVKLIDWFGSCLTLRCGHIDIDRLCERVRELVLSPINTSTSNATSSHHSSDCVTVDCALMELRALYDHLKSLGITEYVVFDLGLVSKRELYSQSLTFQAFIHATDTSHSTASASGNQDVLVFEPVAVGGCYDSLLALFAPPSSDSVMRGCGVNLAVEKLVHAVIDCHLHTRTQRTFPPFAPFLAASSLFATSTAANNTNRRSKRGTAVVASPTIAPIFASPSSTTAPSGFLPPSPGLVSASASVLLFSPRHHLLRERLSLASLLWSDRCPCIFIVPFSVSLSSLFTFLKLHSIRFLVLMRRRLWRERGVVEMIDIATIANARRWDKVISGLKSKEKESSNSPVHFTHDDSKIERERDGVETVLASQTLAWLREHGANIHSEATVTNSGNTSTAASLTASISATSSAAHSATLHVQLVDPNNAIKREQKANIIAAVRRAIAPFTASAVIERSAFALAVDLSIAHIRAFATAYLAHTTNQHSHRSTYSHSQSQSKRDLVLSLPPSISDALAPIIPAKYREYFDAIYSFVHKRCLEWASSGGGGGEVVCYCFLYSICDRKVDIMQCQ